MENKPFILSDINLGKIENIWTKDKNYIIYNEGLLLKNLYIKTEKYTIGIRINRDNYYLYTTLKTGIDEKKRLSLLDNFYRALSLFGSNKTVYINLNLYTPSPGHNYEEVADINAFHLLLEREIDIPNIDKCDLRYHDSSVYKIFRLFNVVILKDMNYAFEIFEKPSLISVNFKLNRKYKKALGLLEN